MAGSHWVVVVGRVVIGLVRLVLDWPFQILVLDILSGSLWWPGVSSLVHTMQVGPTIDE